MTSITPFLQTNSSQITFTFTTFFAESNIQLHSLALQPQADLEDPLLNPSLWPPSTLVRWGEGLALPAIAVAALVANVVLLRCISISL